ncbi:MAG: polysaccharide deacetylase family protein [Hyphomonas sp.]|uniref:polysaccharide deacetylase family protein n=1 Tax=Hyphomonas sp. TaxID=87 RepID=UPI003528DB57
MALPLEATPQRPIVSFTFDDFPKSAAEVGARILEDARGKGTYYACSGMAGTQNETGALFDEVDVRRLTEHGHEIGAHTRSHIDCAQTPLSAILADVGACLMDLKAMGVDGKIRQFAYPYGETTVGLKQRLSSQFDAVRGILSGRNVAGADLMQLRAYELDGSDARSERALAAIRGLRKQPAWVVLFTHDVSEGNSGFGISPATLERLVAEAKSAGADLLTMSDALDSIRGRRS